MTRVYHLNAVLIQRVLLDIMSIITHHVSNNVTVTMTHIKKTFMSMS